MLGPRMVERGQSASDVPNLRGDIAKAWSLKTGLKSEELEILRGRMGESSGLLRQMEAWVESGKPANYYVGAELTMVYLCGN